MRAATQAAWLQVVAAREQLDVRKALRQLVVIPLRYRSAMASALLQRTQHSLSIEATAPISCFL